jgi:hypothetical protein
MEQYRVSVQNGLTVIEESWQGFSMCVYKAGKGEDSISLETPFSKKEVSAVQYGRYIFEMNGANFRSSKKRERRDAFQAAVDFFFRSLLDMDSYMETSQLSRLEISE